MFALVRFEKFLEMLRWMKKWGATYTILRDRPLRSAYSRLLSRIIRAGCVSTIAIAEKLITGEMRRRTNKTKFYQTRRSTHTLRDKLAGRGARAGGNGQKDDRLFGQPLCCRHPWSLASGSPKIRIVDKGTRVRPIYKRSTPPSHSTNSVLIGARDSGIPLESLTSKYLIAWIRHSFHIRSFFFFHSIFLYQFPSTKYLSGNTTSNGIVTPVE